MGIQFRIETLSHFAEVILLLDVNNLIVSFQRYAAYSVITTVNWDIALYVHFQNLDTVRQVSQKHKVVRVEILDSNNQ